MNDDQIERIFTYHPPSDAQRLIYEKLRHDAKVFAQLLNTVCPESREKSLAITRLQECV